MGGFCLSGFLKREVVFRLKRRERFLYFIPSNNFEISSGEGNFPLSFSGRVETILYSATPMGLFDSRRAYFTMFLFLDLQMIMPIEGFSWGCFTRSSRRAR